MFTRKLGWSFLLLAALFLGLTALATVTAAAQDRDDDRDHPWECSVRTLHGRFGWFGQGTVLAVPGVHPALPLVVSGVVTYDGEGHVSSTYNQSAGGAIATGLGAEGTYEVGPDCTYSSQITLLATGSVVNRVGTITGEGKNQEIHLLYTDPSPVAFGTLKRTPERCSLETLKGDYALFGNGTIPVQLPGFPPPPVAIATSGTLTFDGKGGFVGGDTHNLQNTSGLGGAVGPVTFYGTYTVSSDCEVSAVINSSNGLILNEVGSITGDGDFKEIHDIFTNPGWVFTDTLKKQ